MKNKSDKIMGSIKENIGSALDMDRLEAEGKIQKKAGEVMEKAENVGRNMKETLTEKANNLIDAITEKR